MAKHYIDTDKWVTPKKYAELKGISAAAVSKQMKKKGKELNTLIIPELGIKLVEHPDYTAKKNSKKIIP